MFLFKKVISKNLYFFKITISQNNACISPYKNVSDLL